MNPFLLSQLYEFADNKHRVYAIKGKAGTGKTQIIKETVAALTSKGKKCVVLAPTNKATIVLKNRGISAKTLHSALYQCQPRTNEFGEPVTKTVRVPIMNPLNPKDFLKDANGDFLYNEQEHVVMDFIFSPKVPANAILIIDESSMVAATEWKNLLERSSLKIIAVGDINQLEPVSTRLKELEDKVANYDVDEKNQPSPSELYDMIVEEKKLQNQYGRYFIELTVNWEEKVNKRTNNDYIKNIFESLLLDKESRWPVPFICSDCAQIYDKTQFTSDEIDVFLLNTDVVIAHKNSTVDMLNNKIRELKYPMLFNRLKGLGQTLPYPGAGEPLYVTGSFGPDDTILVQKGEIIRIKDDNKKTIDTKNKILYATIVIDSSKEEIENFPIGLELCGERTNKKIASCKTLFGYAITAHKSQGSQWGEVLVWDDCTMYGEQKRRWRYTACTRAEKRLTVIIQGKN